MAPVAVPIDVDCRAAQAAAINDAGMVQLVAINGVAFANQGSDRAYVGRITGWKEERRFSTLEFGQLPFQFGVQSRPAGDERAGAGTPAVLINGRFYCCGNAQISRQAEVVVGSEIDQRLAPD